MAALQARRQQVRKEFSEYEKFNRKTLARLNSTVSLLDQLNDEGFSGNYESLSEWRDRAVVDSQNHTREHKILKDQLRHIDQSIQSEYSSGSFIESNDSHTKHDTTHFLPLHVEKGKKDEAGKMILRYLKARIEQRLFWIAFRYVSRVIKDFQKGNFWEPPGKESGYSGVHSWEREAYAAASQNIWDVIETSQHKNLVTQITQPDMQGYHGKTQVSCEKGDGIKAVWVIMMKYRPCNSVYVRGLKQTLNNSYLLFRRGDIESACEKLRPTLTECLSLGVKIDWDTSGQRVVESSVH